MEQSSFLQYVLFSWFLWGLLFIVVGLYLFVQVMFDISVPYFKIFLALMLVVGGIWVMVFGFGSDAHRNVLVFNEGKLTAPTPPNRFRIVLGRGEIDLTPLSTQANPKPQTIDVFGGWGVIMLDAGAPALVTINSVYSSISMPGMDLKKKTGSVTYVSQAFQDQTAYLPVRVRVWFGELKIFEIEKKLEEGTNAPPAPEAKPQKKQAA